MDRLAMSEASIKRSHIGAAGGDGGAGGGELVVSAAILNSVDTAQLNKVRLCLLCVVCLVCSLVCVDACVLCTGLSETMHQPLLPPISLPQVYTSSDGLDSDAIVAFARCLVAISLDELKDADAPRVFSLTKLVEISHYNMGRIR
jgi:hypothetical protein